MLVGARTGIRLACRSSRKRTERKNPRTLIERIYLLHRGGLVVADSDTLGDESSENLCFITCNEFDNKYHNISLEEIDSVDSLISSSMGTLVERYRPILFHFVVDFTKRTLDLTKSLFGYR